MARSLVAALTLLSMTIRPASAQEIPENITTAADAAGVNPVDLAGAVNTTKMEPETYLYATGELQRPAPPVVPQYGVWDQLAQCESGGNWATNTGNSYFGGLQEDAAFWSNHGGLAYAARPDLASRSAQIQVAINGRDGLVGKAQGWGAWPVCSKRLGLR